MKFDIASSSSWLRLTPAVSATTPSHTSALRRLSSSSCKPTNIISCCSSTPTHSSSSSSSSPSPSARSYTDDGTIPSVVDLSTKHLRRSSAIDQH
ncbi:hypothetical protein Dsin_005577 [Dipteronia sinensis]|uniref:Uncharacterized protein n=1 Tax=Dipteronia sinensis TaxID=43782 RepID=A0AAE0EGM2_9ROSI|nr:hypothetical protein Dsin_005577 [Dipteronia sinensis]